jgi:hypothetical protein
VLVVPPLLPPFAPPEPEPPLPGEPPEPLLPPLAPVVELPELPHPRAAAVSTDQNKKTVVRGARKRPLWLDLIPAYVPAGEPRGSAKRHDQNRDLRPRPPSRPPRLHSRTVSPELGPLTPPPPDSAPLSARERTREWRGPRAPQNTGSRAEPSQTARPMKARPDSLRTEPRDDRDGQEEDEIDHELDRNRPDRIVV